MPSTEVISAVGVGLTMLIAIWLVVSGRRRSNKQASPNTSQLATSLRDEKLKSSIILDGIDDGVLLIDEQENIQLINPAAARISGWDIKEATHLDFKSVLQFVTDKGEDYDESKNPILQAFRQAQTVRDNSANLRTKAGKPIAANVTVSPIFDHSKAVTGVIVLLSDVSKQRAEEHQRADFISTASHEMRTPVAAIEGYLALALNDKVATIDSRGRNYIEKAHQSTQHLGKLFQDLLSSAKAEDGRLSNHPVVIEIGEMLESLTDGLKFSAEKKGLAMEFTLGSGSTIDASKDGGKTIRPLYYVHADPERLREVITNLFDNACKYTESGKVTIGLTGDDKVVQFFIRDTGHGIPAEDVPHLFQKFYRVDNSSTRTIGGTGLGLFICRKIIELYDGRIWVTSEIGKGSTFYINLPRLSSSQAEQLRSQENNLGGLQTTTTPIQS